MIVIKCRRCGRVLRVLRWATSSTDLYGNLYCSRCKRVIRVERPSQIRVEVSARG